MQTVLLIGHDAVGKSTIAQYLSSLYNKSLQISFASSLKADLASLRVPVYTKPYPASVRNLVRQYGETMMELNDDNYWVDRTFDAYHKIIAELGIPDLLICDDCRQWHELTSWHSEFDNVQAIVLTNNTATADDYQYRSVKEVQEIINEALVGKLESLVITNQFTDVGLTDELKLQLKQYVLGN